MFLKNNDLGVLDSALIPHLFPHFFVVFARHLNGFFCRKTRSVLVGSLCLATFINYGRRLIICAPAFGWQIIIRLVEGKAELKGLRCNRDLIGAGGRLFGLDRRPF